jgi:hypothetical protein
VINHLVILPTDFCRLVPVSHVHANMFQGLTHKTFAITRLSRAHTLVPLDANAQFQELFWKSLVHLTPRLRIGRRILPRVGHRYFEK